MGRWSRAFLLGAGVGVAAGLAAAALEGGLHFATARLIGGVAELGGPSVFDFRVELLLLPALGGLFSGVLVALLAPRAAGHGTDQLVRAFHRGDGRLAFRGPAVKASAAVGVIASGGSAGPEGPIAALGAAIGSTAGRWMGLTPRECRVLLLSGCAAAVGALFGCPLGGALFATSILYREEEFEASALVSAFIASAIGYSTYVSIWGQGGRVLGGTGALAFGSAAELPVFLLLGLLCGATAIFFSLVFARATQGFARLTSIPTWLRPAIGGLLTGLLACALPQVMDGDYRTVQGAFDGRFFAEVTDSAGWLQLAALLAAIAVGKCVATAFTVGSGASGGVLGPSVFIGGVVGAALGAALEGMAPGFLPGPVRQALIPVGMAGVLAAAMRTPLAAMVMVMEMTGSFGLIVPLMLVAMTAYVIGRRWGLIDDQVPTSSQSPAHAGDALVHLLEQYRVHEVMDRAWPARATRSTPLPDLLASAETAPSPSVPVVEEGRLVGVVSVSELRHLLDDGEVPPAVIAADLMRERPFTLDAQESLYAGAAAFEQRRAEVIPVVETGPSGEPIWVGMLSRGDVHRVARGYMESMRENLLREHAGLSVIEEESELTHWLAAMAPSTSGGLERVPVDAELVGRSLAELEFRASRGQEVLAIHAGDRQLLCPPDPHRKLEPEDVLLVLTPGSQRGRSGGKGGS